MTDTAAALATAIASIAENIGAEDIKILDVKEVSSIAERLVICTGTSTPHLRAIRDDIITKTKDIGATTARREGDPSSRWIILDYTDVVVHILSPELRSHYAIEELWGDAPTTPFPSLSKDIPPPNA